VSFSRRTLLLGLSCEDVAISVQNPEPVNMSVSLPYYEENQENCLQTLPTDL
jgi:hypothetical protein